MNNYKVVKNISGGTLSIPGIAPDPDGYGMATLYLSTGEQLDLSTRYIREYTQVCANLEKAVTASNLQVISTYPGGTEEEFEESVNTAFGFSATQLELKQPTILNSPNRPAGAYAYFLDLEVADKMTGGAAQKTYVLGLNASRPLGSGATGDSNDALVKGSYSNYAVNDANFIMRGLNLQVNNRDGGVAGMLDHNLGSQGKSGGTVSTIRGLSITAENYGTLSAELGGLDVNLKNEAAVATLEYGLRIRNTNNSLATKVTSAILVADAGANLGYTTGLDLNGSALTNEIVFSNGIVVTVAGDTVVFTKGAKSVTLTLV